MSSTSVVEPRKNGVKFHALVPEVAVAGHVGRWLLQSVVFLCEFCPCLKIRLLRRSGCWFQWSPNSGILHDARREARYRDDPGGYLHRETALCGPCAT